MATIGGGAVVTLLLGACGMDPGGGGVVSTISVTAEDSGFTPSSVTLAKAGTYVFHYTNRGTRQYSVDIEGNGVDTDGDAVDPGKTGDVQVDLGKGTYAMHSQDDGADRSHELHGRVVVQGG